MLFGAFDLAEDRNTVLVKVLGGGGWPRAAGVAFEQFDRQRFFQITQLQTEAGLGAMQARRGAVDAAFLINGDKRANMA